MKPHCSTTMLYLLLPRNPSSCHRPSLFLQVAHFSTQSPNFHSQPLLSHSSRRYEDESRNVRVSVWWDFENCHIPAGVNVFRVAQTITAAIRANGMKGPVQITAFGDVQQLSRTNQEALSSTGINLSHIPNGSLWFSNYDHLIHIIIFFPVDHQALIIVAFLKKFSSVVFAAACSDHTIVKWHHLVAYCVVQIDYQFDVVISYFSLFQCSICC